VTVAEAAVIAGLLKAPSRYSPFANPGYARARARVVIQAMMQARLISPVSAAAASRQSVHFATPEIDRQPTGLEYAVDYVLDRLPPLASVAKRTVVVETTIDPDVQRRAQSVVSDMLAEEGAAAKVGQGAVVVLDTSGGVRALVGGRSFAESQFNRAVKARRQPGSAFKPFVYIAALENGMWPDTPVEDAPIEIGNWSPRNDDGRYRGPITLTQALAHSVNTVAVRLQQQIGSGKVANVARRLGIKSDLRPDASMALGTSEVGLLELCGAYGTLAAGGLAVDPFVVQRIRTTEGAVLFERPEPSPRMVVAPDTIGAINTMLNAAIVSGTGRRAAFARHQAAGKTGTTQDFRDAWFVGYTAHLVAGVWLGNDDGSPMNHVTGGSLPARMWRAVMEPAHAALAPRSLPAIGASVLDPTRAPEPLEHEPPTLPAPATVSEAILSAATVEPAAAGKIEIPNRRLRKPLTRPERAAETIVRSVKAAAPQTHRPRARNATPVHKADRTSPHRMPTRPIDPEIFAKAMSEDKKPIVSIPRTGAGPKPASVPGGGIDAARIRDALRDLGKAPAGRMSLGVRPPG
jgi:penicillin-binding protein 1A